jgi:hypothetical protein
LALDFGHYGTMLFNKMEDIMDDRMAMKPGLHDFATAWRKLFADELVSLSGVFYTVEMLQPLPFETGATGADAERLRKAALAVAGDGTGKLGWSELTALMEELAGWSRAQGEQAGWRFSKYDPSDGMVPWWHLAWFDNGKGEPDGDGKSLPDAEAA